jgi:hypothetical protein
VGLLGIARGRRRPANGLTVATRSALVRLIAVAVAAFSILMLSRPETYFPPFYRGVGALCFSTFGGDRVVRFDAIDGENALHDTTIRIGIRKESGPAFASALPVNSVREGFVPIAVVLALCAGLASVSTLRLAPTLIAIGATEGFVLFRTAVALAYGFSRGTTSWIRPVLGFLNHVVGTDLDGTYVAPILIWALTSLRTSQLLEDLQHSSSSNKRRKAARERQPAPS